MIDHRGLKVVVGDSDRTVLELLQIRLDVAGFHTCVARSVRPSATPSKWSPRRHGPRSRSA